MYLKVTRKPLQIFFIEHLLYPAVAFIFLTLFVNYGVKLAARYSELPPHQNAAVIMAIFAFFSSILIYVFIPFSCYRLWISAEKYLEGAKKLISKAYSGILFVVLAVLGIEALVDLPLYIDILQGFFNKPNPK